MGSYTASTSMVKQQSIKRDWLLIDAKNMTMGRLASRIAIILRGKHKPCYTPHMDCGDNVVVINADQVKITGNKLEQEKFHWHTGHPGGIKSITWKKMLQNKFGERLLSNAVKRMLPKESPLARSQFKRMKIYTGENHPHSGQVPLNEDITLLKKKSDKNNKTT